MTLENTTNNSSDSLFTPKEVAVMFKVSYRTILKLIKQGDISATVLAGKYRIKSSDLDIFIANNMVHPREQE